MAKKPVDIEKYDVEISRNAENDLHEIIMFIAQNNPQTAFKIMEKIRAKINTLKHFPQRGSYVSELLKKNIKDYRQITEHPWKIIYSIDGKTVNILAVIDSRRNLKELLVKKLLTEK